MNLRPRFTLGCRSSSSRWTTPDGLTDADEEQPPIDLLRPYDADGMNGWKVSLDVEEREKQWAGIVCWLGTAKLSVNRKSQTMN